MLAHKAVALAFIPNPYNLPCVNHKDEDKSNNFVENLEWCTIAYNNNYSDNGRRSGIKTSKKVYCYNLDGTLYKIFGSAKEAAKNFGISDGTISGSAQWKEYTPHKKRVVTAGGKIFSLKERTKEEIINRLLSCKSKH